MCMGREERIWRGILDKIVIRSCAVRHYIVLHGYVCVSFLQSIDMSDQDLLARTTSILRNALTELEATLSANRTNNNVGAKRY